MTYLTKIAGTAAAALLLVTAAAPGALALSKEPLIGSAQPVEFVGEFEEFEEEADIFAGFLHEPEFLLAMADEIGLTDNQREEIIDLVVETQSYVTRRTLESTLTMNELVVLLDADRIDADAALAVADELMETENEAKRMYLRLMIEVHNSLSSEQRERLKELEFGLFDMEVLEAE